MTPRDYQEAAINSIFRYFAEGGVGNPLVLMPTGTGKSVVIGEFVKRTLMQWPHSRLMMLTHVKELIAQNMDKLIKVWPLAPVGIYSAGLGKKDAFYPVTFGGVSSVAKAKNMLSFGKIDLLLIDEAHLVSPNDAAQYNKIIKAFKKTNPNLKVIGFTATDFRLGHGKLTENDHLFTDVCINMTTLEGFNWFIEEGYLVPLIPKKPRLQIDISNVHMRGGEYVENEAQAVMDKHEITRAAIDEMLEYGAERKRWLIFAQGVNHAEHVHQMLIERGANATYVHSKMSKQQRDDAINGFKTGYYDVIVNNGILTTGFDCPEVDLIGVLRLTQSPGLWCLDEKTEILTNNGFKTWNTLDPICDNCAAVDNITLEFSYEKITGFLHKAPVSDEFFVTLNRPALDIKVTNKHNLLIRIMKGRNSIRTAPFFEVAENLKNYWSVEIPVSANNFSKRQTTLTNDELIFLGLYLSDGHIDKSNNALSISQSERYPAVLCEIERCLISLGLKYSKKEICSDPLGLRGFKTNFKTYIFQISKGKPRKTNLHLRGWGYLEKFVDKSISPDLMTINREEFSYLLKGLNLGDGSKSVKGIDWIRRTMEIAMGINADYANRVQILAIKNGYRASLSHNGANCYILRIKNLQWANVSKAYTKAAHGGWQTEPCNESVWCVENNKGTLITRRNGKITIMGNCQILGRGTRPVYAEGYDLNTKQGRLSAIAGSVKKSCLVLDFAGNTKRLGPINNPIIPRFKGSGGGGLAPVKVCEFCMCYNHASVRYCKECGTEFIAAVKIQQYAGTENLIAENEVKELDSTIFNVDKITYKLHKNRSGLNNSLKVSYYCGLRRFAEYICLEHKGYPLVKARNWWRDASTEPQKPVPITIDAALDNIDKLKPAKRIRVLVKETNSEIINYEY